MIDALTAVIPSLLTMLYIFLESVHAGTAKFVLVRALANLKSNYMLVRASSSVSVRRATAALTVSCSSLDKWTGVQRFKYVARSMLEQSLRY